MIGGGGDADGAKDARAKLGTRSESVYKDRFRPSLDCELRLGQAAACGWLEKHPSVRAARPPRGRTKVPRARCCPSPSSARSGTAASGSDGGFGRSGA